MPDLTRMTVAQDASAETLWVAALSDDLYRIDSIPFQTLNLSLGDVVRAVQRDGVLQFDQLYDKSGNQTVLISVDPPTGAELTRRVLELITELRFRYETAADRFIAVNVPPVAADDFLLRLEMLSRDGVRYECLDPSVRLQLPVVPGSPAEVQRERAERAVLQWFEARMTRDRGD